MPISPLPKNLIYFLIFTLPLAAQHFEKKINPFVVEEGGRSIPWPCIGGQYVPKAEFQDIDGDLDADLFVTQVDGRITFLENDGTRFIFVTDFFDSIAAGNWSRFADIDGDGDLDLFTEAPSSYMRLYENKGDSTDPHFVLKDSLVRDSLGQAIVTENQSIPFFADIDGDGDLDFFTGRSVGSLALYENVGTSVQYCFKLKTEQFENILIVTAAKTVAPERHGASGIVFLDIDGDGDLDLFWGDFFSKGMYYLENSGNRLEPHFPAITSSAFPGDILTTMGFNVPSFADADGDGDVDLIASVLYREQDKDNFWYFRNNSITKTIRHVPSFEFVTSNFIEGLDVGRNANPVLTDLDNDLDQDLVIGSYQGKIHVYRNVSQVNDLRFSRDTTITIPFPAGEFISSPAFADIDNDGDQDCLAGSYSGRILFFRNTGSLSSPSFELTSNFFQSLDVGNYSAPAFCDIDHDGDFDLFIGEEDGTVHLFKNIGTPEWPQFDTPLIIIPSVPDRSESVPEIVDYDRDGDFDMFVGYKDGTISYFENRGDVNVPVLELVTKFYQGLKATQNAVPRFADMDADLDFDLIMGNVRGGIEYYEAGEQRPLLSEISPSVGFVDSVLVLYASSSGNPSPVYSLIAAPSGMSIHRHSGRISWKPSYAQKGMHTVTVRAVNAVGSDETSFTVTVKEWVPAPIVLRQNYPNPFNAMTVIRFGIRSESRVTLKIYNILGQEIRTLVDDRMPEGMHSVSWDGLDRFGRSVASGLYVYRMKAGSHTKVSKMLLIK